MFAKTIEVPTQEVRDKLKAMVEFDKNVASCKKISEAIEGVTSDADMFLELHDYLESKQERKIVFGEEDFMREVSTVMVENTEKVNEIWNKNQNFFFKAMRSIFGKHEIPTWDKMKQAQRNEMAAFVEKNIDLESYLKEYGDEVAGILEARATGHDWYLSAKVGFAEDITEVCSKTDWVVTKNVDAISQERIYSIEKDDFVHVMDHSMPYRFFVTVEGGEAFSKAIGDYKESYETYCKNMAELKRAIVSNSVFFVSVDENVWKNVDYNHRKLSTAIANLNNLIDSIGEKK